MPPAMYCPAPPRQAQCLPREPRIARPRDLPSPALPAMPRSIILASAGEKKGLRGFSEAPMSKPDQGRNTISYRDAGVDIDAGNALVEAIKPLARATQRPGADASLGGF